MAPKTERQKIIEGWLRKLQRYQLMWLMFVRRLCSGGGRLGRRKKRECCGLGRAFKYISIVILFLSFLFSGIVYLLQVTLAEAPRAVRGSAVLPTSAHEHFDFDATFDFLAMLKSGPAFSRDGSEDWTRIYRVSDYVMYHVSSSRELRFSLRLASDHSIEISSKRMLPLLRPFYAAATVHAKGNTVAMRLYLDGDLIDEKTVTGVVSSPYLKYLSVTPRWPEKLVVDRSSLYHARVWQRSLEPFEIRLLRVGCQERVEQLFAASFPHANSSFDVASVTKNLEPSSRRPSVPPPPSPEEFDDIHRKKQRVVKVDGVRKLEQEDNSLCSSSSVRDLVTFTDQQPSIAEDSAACSTDQVKGFTVITPVRELADLYYLETITWPHLATQKAVPLKLLIVAPEAFRTAVQSSAVLSSNPMVERLFVPLAKRSALDKPLRAAKFFNSEKGTVDTTQLAIRGLLHLLSDQTAAKESGQDFVGFLPARGIPGARWPLSQLTTLCRSYKEQKNKGKTMGVVGSTVLSENGRIWSSGIQLKVAHYNSLSTGLLPYWFQRGEPIGNRRSSVANVLPSLWGLIGDVASFDSIKQSLQDIPSRGIYGEAAVAISLAVAFGSMGEEKTENSPVMQPVSVPEAAIVRESSVGGHSSLEPLRHDSAENAREAHRFVLAMSSQVEKLFGMEKADVKGGAAADKGQIMWVADCGGIEAWEGVTALSQLEAQSTPISPKSNLAYRLFFPPSATCHSASVENGALSSSTGQKLFSSADDEGENNAIGGVEEDSIDFSIDSLPLHLKEDALRYQTALLDSTGDVGTVVVHARDFREYGLWVIEEPAKAIGRYSLRHHLFSSVSLPYASHLDGLAEVWTPYRSVINVFRNSGIARKRLRVVPLLSPLPAEARESAILFPGLVPSQISQQAQKGRLLSPSLPRLLESSAWGVPEPWPVDALIGRVGDISDSHSIDDTGKSEESAAARPFIFLFSGSFSDESGWTDAIEAFCKSFTPADDVVLLLRPLSSSGNDGSAGSELTSYQYSMYKAGRARGFSPTECGRIGLLGRQSLTTDERSILYRSVDALLVPSARSDPGSKVKVALSLGLNVFGPRAGGLKEACEELDSNGNLCVLVDPVRAESEDTIIKRSVAVKGRTRRWRSAGEAIPTRAKPKLSPNEKKQGLASAVVSGHSDDVSVDSMALATAIQKHFVRTHKKKGARKAAAVVTPLGIAASASASLDRARAKVGEAFTSDGGQTRHWASEGEADHHRARLWPEHAELLSSLLTRAMQSSPCADTIDERSEKEGEALANGDPHNSHKKEEIRVVIMTPYFQYASKHGDRLPHHAISLIGKLQTQAKIRDVSLVVDIIALSSKAANRAKNRPLFGTKLEPLMVIDPRVVEDYHRAAAVVNSADYDAVFVEHDFVSYGGKGGEEDEDFGISLLHFVKHLRPVCFVIAHDVSNGVETRALSTSSSSLSSLLSPSIAPSLSSLTSSASSLFASVGADRLLFSSSQLTFDMVKTRQQIVLSLLSFYSARVLTPTAAQKARLARLHNVPACHIAVSSFVLPRASSRASSSLAEVLPKKATLEKLARALPSDWSAVVENNDVAHSGSSKESEEARPEVLKKIILIHALPHPNWGVEAFIEAFAYSGLTEFEVVVVFEGGNKLNRALYSSVKTARASAAAFGVRREVHFVPEDALESPFEAVLEKREGAVESAQKDPKNTEATEKTEEKVFLEDFYSAATLFVECRRPDEFYTSPYLDYAVSRGVPVLSTAVPQSVDYATFSESDRLSPLVHIYDQQSMEATVEALLRATSAAAAIGSDGGLRQDSGDKAVTDVETEELQLVLRHRRRAQILG